MRTAESVLHEQVCDCLRLQWPEVLFRTDFAAGEKLTMSQAVRNKRLQKSRAWPDLFVAEPRGGKAGMYLEFKKEGTVLYLRDGTFTKDKHLNEQREVLESLEARGYRASFAVGFDHAVQLIGNYLKGG